MERKIPQQQGGKMDDCQTRIYRQSSVKSLPIKILQAIIPFIFFTLFHTTHNNPGYRKNRAKVHSQ